MLVAIGVAVYVGATVQTTVGIGLGLIAAPVVTLLAPQLMPGSMLMLVSVLPLITLAREREDIDWRGIGWTTPPRIVGTALGVWVVSWAGERYLGLLVGLMVLLAVALTATAVRVPVNRVSYTGAGLVSGVIGTASSIGGPPMALLVQHEEPRRIRTTLAVYFCLGSGMSLVGLSLAGQVTLLQVQVAALLVPVLVVGAEVSRLLRRHLRPALVRPAVLLVCAASSLALVVRSLV